MSAKLKINLDKSKPIVNRQYGLIRHSATILQLNIFDDGVVYPADNLAADLIIADKNQTFSIQITGNFVEDNIIEIPISDTDLGYAGNLNYEIRVYEDSQQFINLYGELRVHANANGSGDLPATTNVIDWMDFTGYINVINHGPYIGSDLIEIVNDNNKGKIKIINLTDVPIPEKRYLLGTNGWTLAYKDYIIDDLISRVQALEAAI